MEICFQNIQQIIIITYNPLKTARKKTMLAEVITLLLWSLNTPAQQYFRSIQVIKVSGFNLCKLIRSRDVQNISQDDSYPAN